MIIQQLGALQRPLNRDPEASANALQTRFALLVDGAGMIENVAHFLLLGSQVALEALLGLTSADTRSVTAIPAASNAATFSGLLVIRRTLETPKQLQRPRRKIIITAIGSEAEFFIRLHCIASAVLKLVGLQFGHQADAAAFLLLVDQHAGAGLGDHGERQLQLLTAIAAHGIETHRR